MVRWEPGTRDRLREAALDLFASRGYEETTAAEIATAAGVTERTFFRYFADKREVLFSGREYLERFLAGLDAAPAGAAPLELAAAGVEAGSSYFTDELRSHSRRRQAVIDANPALKEREVLKGRHLAVALAQALRDRGVAEPAATLAGETGATVFHVAFGQWLADGETRSIAEIARGLFAELGALHTR